MSIHPEGILPLDDQPSYYDWNQRFQTMPVIKGHPLVKGLDFSNIWVEANNRPSPWAGCTVITEMSPLALEHRCGSVLLAAPAGGDISQHLPGKGHHLKDSASK